MYLILISYLLGSIPFGLLWGRLAGIDVRAAGSGNIGATNVNRLLGKKFGIATLLCDVGKGILPMIAAAYLGFSENVVLACGLAAFSGHLFPVYLKFQGGKGVATALGIFLYLSPAACAIVVAVFAALVWISGFVSVGSLSATAAMPVILYLFHASTGQIYLALAVAVLIWIKHHQNIARLMRGEENSWRGGDKKR